MNQQQQKSPAVKRIGVIRKQLFMNKKAIENLEISTLDAKETEKATLKNDDEISIFNENKEDGAGKEDEDKQGNESAKPALKDLEREAEADGVTEVKNKQVDTKTKEGPRVEPQQSDQMVANEQLGTDKESGGVLQNLTASL